jgi:hypothetical protein
MTGHETETPSKELNEFIVAQYTQLWELIRTHLSFSWQIPALTMIIISALLTTIPKNLVLWEKAPDLSSFAFLILALTIFVLFTHHRRNQIFVRAYGAELRGLERKYGIKIQAHHFNINKRLKGFDKVSSTSLLTIFLGISAALSFLASIYFLLRVYGLEI